MPRNAGRPADWEPDRAGLDDLRVAAESGASLNQNPHQAQALRRLRQQRAVERVCKIPRLVSELLAEIGRVHGIESDIAARLERYAAVDHDLLAVLGADRFPPSLVRVVGGGQ